MNKPKLYITEQGAYLREKPDHLLVAENNETLLEFECTRIQTIVISGNTGFSTQLLNELFELALLTLDGYFRRQRTPASQPQILHIRPPEGCRITARSERDQVPLASKAHLPENPSALSERRFRLNFLLVEAEKDPHPMLSPTSSLIASRIH